MENFYKKKSVQKYVKKLPNPGFGNHMTPLPSRILIVGGTGSMKTNLLMNFLKKARDTFTLLIVCCKSKEEPLYLSLESQLKGLVQFYENGEVPDLKDVSKEMSGDEQCFIVFDDLCMEKDQSKITQYFIRSRKFNITCAYLTQSYFETPKTIRLNCSAIWLKQLHNMKDLGAILSDFTLGVDKDEIKEKYRYATGDNPLHFLYIDLYAPMNERFRKNFLEII